MQMDPSLEPLDLRSAIRSLEKQLLAFEESLQLDLGDQDAAERIWDAACNTKTKMEEFHALLMRYWNSVNGVLQFRNPEAYRKRIFPRIQHLVQGGRLEDLRLSGPNIPQNPRGQLGRPDKRPRSLLDLAEEVFRANENKPLSTPNLVQEMKERGVEFGAKDPVKSLAQTMRSSPRFTSPKRGFYCLREEGSE